MYVRHIGIVEPFIVIVSEFMTFLKSVRDTTKCDQIANVTTVSMRSVVSSKHYSYLIY